MSMLEALGLGLCVGVGCQLGANIVKAIWKWWNA
jgi:hypothetical protein